jgi:hypothetical protein
LTFCLFYGILYCPFKTKKHPYKALKKAKERIKMTHLNMIPTSLAIFFIFLFLLVVGGIETGTFWSLTIIEILAGSIFLLNRLHEDGDIPGYVRYPMQVVCIGLFIIIFFYANDCVDKMQGTSSGFCKVEDGSYWRRYIESQQLQQACECTQKSDCESDEQCVVFKYRSGGKKGSFENEAICVQQSDIDYIRKNFDVSYEDTLK